MTPALVLACLWVLLAGVATLLPRRYHWMAAGVLIVLGLPLLFMIFWQNGPWVGLVALAVALSVLRWPAIRLARWLGLALGRRRGEG